MWKQTLKVAQVPTRVVKSLIRSKITVVQTKAAKQAPQSSRGPVNTGATAKIKIPTTKQPLQMPNEEKERALAKIQYEIRTHHKHGNYTDALSSSEQLLKESREHFGKDHPVTASSYNNIGLMHKHLGNWAESRKNYHESLRIYGRVVGKDHASYAAALHNIGSLNNLQAHLDTGLTAIQRLQLNEEALEHLQDAWRIRQVELGEDHQYTIASRSSYGATLASQVLQTIKSSKNKKMSKLTEQRWNAAEDHLRQALKQALDIPQHKDVKSTLKGHIKTLSAASAAQNLAIFLKTRVTDIVDEDTINVLDYDVLAEARQLYEEVLDARQELLADTHPDLVATKFSMAELMVALGENDAANELREEIVKSYDVQEVDGSEEGK
mmetsp:Transcript_27430/g.40515  ORF Transcript_27430/g.40515 Transcript_27430/m.40515 type:complete len:381 (+) Transcript_27430:129-1271(+)